MKFLSLLALLITTTSQATVWNCDEIRKPNTRPGSLGITSVRITEKENITEQIRKGGKKVDSASIVLVEIFNRKTKTSAAKLTKSFQAIALTSDVEYDINTEIGITFWNYLDEMDQAGIKLQDGRTVRLSCTNDEQD